MMYPRAFLAALLASTAQAIPSPRVFTNELWAASVYPLHHAHKPVIRQEPVKEKAGVYICEHYNWGGVCEHKSTPLGSAPEDCTVINGTASSIGPDRGFFCIFYTNAFCSALLSDGSDSLTLQHPGSPNLINTDKGNFNDKLLSYQCFKTNVTETPPAEPPVEENPPVVLDPPTKEPPVEPPTEEPTVIVEPPTKEPAPSDTPSNN